MRITLAVAGSITLLSGCTSFYPLRPNEEVPPTQTVAITFAAERDLEATRDTVSYRLPAVSRVYGRVEAVRSDTLVLRSLHVESSRTQPQVPGSARLTIVPDATARVSMRRVSTAKTVGLIGLALVGLAAVAAEGIDDALGEALVLPAHAEPGVPTWILSDRHPQQRPP